MAYKCERKHRSTDKQSKRAAWEEEKVLQQLPAMAFGMLIYILLKGRFGGAFSEALLNSGWLCLK